MIKQITKAYIWHYRDNGQTVAYVEWIDAKGRTGCTQGSRDNPHMSELFARANREGVHTTFERW